MFKRIVLLRVFVFVVALLSLSSQANPAAAPGSATPTAPPPATKPGQEVQLQLLSMTLGGTAYVMCFALAEIVSKNHPWLRITAAETKGSIANLLTMSNEPALRKNTLFFTNEESNSWAREGRPPFKSPYKSARAVASMAETTLIFATLDKKIKSKTDVDGKRVMTMQKGTSTAVIYETLFNDVWAIKPRLSYGDFTSIKDALKDGLIDMGTQPINGMPGVGYRAIPTLQELMSSGDVYFVSVPAEDVIAVAKKGNFSIYPHTIPARAIGDKQPEAVQGYAHSLSWWADDEMSEGIVYEVTKTIYDNADKFRGYHRDGEMVTKQTMARIGVSEDLFHPGALKFYREKGIKTGIH
jgi:hypothetical protein